MFQFDKRKFFYTLLLITISLVKSQEYNLPATSELLIDSLNITSSNSSDLSLSDDIDVISFETAEPVSFGIRSFTVEVTTPTEKPHFDEGKNKSYDVTKTVIPSTIITLTTEENLLENLTQNEELTVTSDSSSTVDYFTITDTDDQISNEIKVEKKVDNGLYRFKLAEITTNEFENGIEQNIPEEVGKARKIHPYNDGKINILDLYQTKIDDFKPVLDVSNSKLLKEKDVLRGVDNNENTFAFQKIDLDNIPTSKIEIELIDDLSSSSTKSVDTLNIRSDDLTGKLQENDEVIKKIEESFKPEEDFFPNLKTESFTESTTVSDHVTKPTVLVNEDLLRYSGFIDRRVKKNDPSVKYKFFNSQNLNLKREDIANTKFNADTTDVEGGGLNKKEKPEFSTTKFYNSKELYSEILHKNLDVNPTKQSPYINFKLNKPLTTVFTGDKSFITAKPLIKTTTNINSPKLEKSNVENIEKKHLQPTEFSLVKKENSQVFVTPANNNNEEKPTEQPQIFATQMEQNNKKIWDDDSSRGKNNVKEISTVDKETTSEYLNSVSTTIQTNTIEMDLTTVQNHVKMFFSRPPVITHLQEKINLLECEIANLPQETNVWHGNQTHTLNLPITVSFFSYYINCSGKLVISAHFHIIFGNFVFPVKLIDISGKINISGFGIFIFLLKI